MEKPLGGKSSIFVFKCLFRLTALLQQVYCFFLLYKLHNFLPSGTGSLPNLCLLKDFLDTIMEKLCACETFVSIFMFVIFLESSSVIMFCGIFICIT